MSYKTKIKQLFCNHELVHRIRFDYDQVAYIEHDLCLKCKKMKNLRTRPLNLKHKPKNG